MYFVEVKKLDGESKQFNRETKLIRVTLNERINTRKREIYKRNIWRCDVNLRI